MERPVIQIDESHVNQMPLPRTTFPFLRLSCLFLLLLFGCGHSDVQTASAPVSPPISPPHADQSVYLTTPPWISQQPISDEEALIVARKFEQAVRATNVKALARILDKDILLSQVAANTNIDATFRRGFITGAKQGEIEKNMLLVITKGGRIELLRIHEENGEKRAIFRIMKADGGLSYWDAILNKSASGVISVVDLHNYLDGEKLSSQLRRLMFAAAKQAASLSKAGERDGSSMISDIMKLKQAADHFQAGSTDETLHICKSLPEYLKNEKAVLVLRIQAASMVSEQECGDAIREFRLHYPNDPCIELLLIDYLIIKHQFDEAIEAIDRLDGLVNSDVYLNIIRAHLLAMSGDFERASELAWSTVHRLPKEIDAYWCIATVELLKGNHRDMALTIQEIKKRFGSEFDRSFRLPKHAHLRQHFAAHRRLQTIANQAQRSFSEVTNALRP